MFSALPAEEWGVQDEATIERIRRKYEALKPEMDERMCRQWAATEALELGWAARRQAAGTARPGADLVAAKSIGAESGHALGGIRAGFAVGQPARSRGIAHPIAFRLVRRRGHRR